MSSESKLPVYKEWLESFAGEKVSIIEFTSDITLKDKDGSYIPYAAYSPFSKKFALNRYATDNKDDMFIMGIAAHEAGHFWDKGGMKKHIIRVILLRVFIVITSILFYISFMSMLLRLNIIATTFICLFCVGYAICVLLYIYIDKQDVGDELRANLFVVDFLGLASQFHVTINILSDILDDFKKGLFDKNIEWTFPGLPFIEEYIEELGIKR